MEYHAYIVKAGPFIKIGYTKNINKRLKAIQTSNPYEVELLAKMPFHTKQMAAEQERYLHHRCRKYHVRGEWFYQEAQKIVFARASKKLKSTRNERILTLTDIRWQAV